MLTLIAGSVLGALAVPDASAESATFSIEVSNRVTQSRLMPAVRVSPPHVGEPGPVVVASEAPAQAPAANASTCRNDLGTPTMTVAIPSISYVCPMYAGGQATLNSGAVTMISDPAMASVLATTPGGAGTLWLAGHRVSHGGAFAAVPSLTDGAIIVVTDQTATATYQVVSRAYVAVRDDQVVDAAGHATGAATVDSILRTDRGGSGASRLVLQTCDGTAFRWMIYADLISTVRTSPPLT